MIPLKVDPKLFHHYLIGVSMHGIRMKEKAGQMFLKYGPIYFTNDDVDKVLTAVMLSDDKLFKTTEKEALTIHGCKDLVSNIGSMRMSINVNQCTLHHFSSGVEIDDEWFVTMVRLANTSPSNKELLDKSRIHC